MNYFLKTNKQTKPLQHLNSALTFQVLLVSFSFKGPGRPHLAPVLWTCGTAMPRTGSLWKNCSCHGWDGKRDKMGPGSQHPLKGHTPPWPTILLLRLTSKVIISRVLIKGLFIKKTFKREKYWWWVWRWGTRRWMSVRLRPTWSTDLSSSTNRTTQILSSSHDWTLCVSFGPRDSPLSDWVAR